MHRLVRLSARLLVVEATAQPLDLNPRPRLALDVLDKQSSRSDDLCPNVEVADRFELNGQLDFGPLSALAPSLETIVPSGGDDGGVGTRTRSGSALAETFAVSSPLGSVLDELSEVLVDEHLYLWRSGSESFVRARTGDAFQGKEYERQPELCRGSPCSWRRRAGTREGQQRWPCSYQATTFPWSLQRHRCRREAERGRDGSERGSAGIRPDRQGKAETNLSLRRTLGEQVSEDRDSTLSQNGASTMSNNARGTGRTCFAGR